MKRLGIVCGGIAVAGLAVTAFAGVAVADPSDCPVYSPGAYVCGPYSQGVDPQSAGWGQSALVEESTWGTSALTVFHDDGTRAYVFQYWYNSADPSGYQQRQTDAFVSAAPQVLQSRTTVAGMFDQASYHGPYEGRDTRVGAAVQTEMVPGSASASGQLIQSKRTWDADGCDQEYETHLRFGAQSDDSYHPSSTCAVEIPEVPVLPQVGNHH